MTLGELIVNSRNIGDQFASWFLIDTNVESIELLGNSEEGYRVEVKVKKDELAIHKRLLDRYREVYDKTQAKLDQLREKAPESFCKVQCPNGCTLQDKYKCEKYMSFIDTLEE